MKLETRRFKTRTNILIVPETADDKELLDELGPLGAMLRAETRLADGYGEYYLMVEGQERVT